MKGTVRAAVLVATALGLLIATAGTAQAGQRSQPSMLDARAAATAAGRIGITSSWFTGTVAAGGSQGWIWNNAPSDAAYVVGFNPSGASTSATCQFQVTSSRYVQQWGGEREFHFTIKNVGSIACGATILLTAVSSSVISSTGGVSPGGTQVHLWTNLPWHTNWVVGINPSGATSSAACQFQVVRSWYVQPSSGYRQFWFEIKNVGGITCQADLRLASTTVNSSFNSGYMSPGATWSATWNNANPVTSAYLVGLGPASASPNQCQLEVTRLIYRQRINSDGSSERELRVTIKNVGTVSCSGLVQLRTIAA